MEPVTLTIIIVAAAVAIGLTVWVIVTLNSIRRSLENINRITMHIANSLVDKGASGGGRRNEKM